MHKKIFSIIISLILVLTIFGSALAVPPAPYDTPWNSEMHVRSNDVGLTINDCYMHQRSPTGALEWSDYVDVAADTGEIIFPQQDANESASHKNDCPLGIITENFSQSRKRVAAATGINIKNLKPTGTQPNYFYYNMGLVAYKGYAGFHSTFHVKNGPINNNQVYFIYKVGNGGTACSEYQYLDAYDIRTYKFSESGCGHQLSSGTKYTLEVIGKHGPISVHASLYDTNSNALYQYSGTDYGDDKIWIPAVYKNHYGYNSSIHIVNFEPSQATITVKYYPSGKTQTVYAYGYTYIDVSVPDFSSLPNGLHSVRITANKRIGATVFSNNMNPLAAFAGTAFLDKDVTRYSIFPVFYHDWGAYKPRQSSVMCQNVGTVSTQVKYLFEGGQSWTSPTVSVGKYSVLAGGNIPLSSGTRSSLNAYATSGSGKVACWQNVEYTDDTPSNYDKLYSFEGIPGYYTAPSGTKFEIPIMYFNEYD